MSVQFSLQGLTEVKARLNKAILESKPVMQSELTKFAELIMEDSQANYVPVAPDGGALQATGKVTPMPFVSPRMVEVILSYGGGITSAYAIAIHERPDFDPPTWMGKVDLNWTKPGTGPKYLELPVMEHSKDLPEVGVAVFVRLFSGISRVA